jgi:RNA polymerase sigma-70 factor
VPPAIDPALARRLHARAGAVRWDLDVETFAAALETSVRKTFGVDAHAAPGDVERFLAALHLVDLALACACAAGREPAWDHLMATHRPILYRAADSLDPSGRAREVADALWAELYGVRGRAESRGSLLRSFHGRSTLATWLRAVLAQRHVDRFRATRRDRPLPDDEAPAALPAPARPPDPERARQLALMRDGLNRAVAALAPRERLRLRCYYAEGLTLAETGRVAGEHEATVSRQLARTRASIRAAVERFLAGDARLDEAQIEACFASVTADAGPIDLGELFDEGPGRKKLPPDRSQEERAR